MGTEEEILLDCLRCNLDADQFGLPELPLEMDWERLILAANKHRALGSLLFVEKTHPGFWPAPMAQRITSQRLSYLYRRNAAVMRVQAVLTGLERAMIPAVVLKGWEYIYTVYDGDFSLRPCGDIDLLIHPQDLRSAESVLAGSGFNPVMELWPGFRYRYKNSAHHYQLPPENGRNVDFGVDLHWGLFNQVYLDRFVSIEEIFSRAQPLLVGDVQALRLSVEDHILYAAGHLAFHHAYQMDLFRFYELAWVIRRSAEKLNWDLLFARAAQWNLQIPLQVSLSQLDKLFPNTLPDPEMARLLVLRPARAEREVYRLLMKYRETPFSRVLPWRWTPGAIWESVCFLFEAFVPGPRFLEHRYGKTRFWPLHYLKRAGGALRQLFSFLRKS